MEMISGNLQGLCGAEATAGRESRIADHPGFEIPLFPPAKPASVATDVRRTKGRRRPCWATGDIITGMRSWSCDCVRCIAVWIFQHALVSVEFFRDTGIHGRRFLTVLSFVLLTGFILLGCSVSKIFFEQDRVSSVAFINCICQVADEWDQTDKEVNDDVEHHPGVELVGKSSIDVLAIANHHHGQRGVEAVSNTAHSQSAVQGG